ncbi:hypothetical protein [Streptomyces decoyicus]|uniref:hypothetical protein n=1 Tax=Streptomyces decoyicus TaxID=249567 RepID=UPI000A62A4AA|nr:hypothetical protein [Streptomyces decoyicus]QZY20036.1 hypothetical protein K7C20_36435 [Streptomyces decoyicus]
MDDSEEPPVAPGVCDLCGMPLPPTTQIYSLVPDSSFIHPNDPDHDGLRRLAACGPDHLSELQQQYRTRPFVKEELWAGKVARALRTQPDLDEEELADMTGLNYLQIERSLTWESECFLRDRSFPNDHDGPTGEAGTQNTEEPN